MSARLADTARNSGIVASRGSPGTRRPDSTTPATPFFTTKPPGRGTGLGLALSRTYLEREGSTIVGENVETGGARFRIKMPVIAHAEA